MKLYELLKCQLKKEHSLISDNGELKKWVVMSKAQNFDAGLIGLLLEDKALEEKFFLDVKGVLVFNQNLFVHFLEQKNYLPDSYTQYKNKVGLTIAGKYLKQRNEVALVWPFKDCVLEGGQSREEDKRKEIFFNEILAQDEITQLLEPKVLTNANTYDHEGRKVFEGFARDTQGTIRDNLIIKGNNLLALHSLKKAFAGKVKLIYIDPPYNTGNDGFKYNDSFNHSTWLVFMKNRLEVARELLRKDGVIFVQCDDNEQAYLKVLMDEVFGRDNFRNLIVSKVGTKNVQNQFETWDKLSNACDLLLFYSKDSKYRFPKAKKKIDIKAGSWNNHWRGTDRPTMRYELFGITPQAGQWRWSKKNSLEAIANYKTMIKEIGKEESQITQEEIDSWYLEKNDSSISLLRLSKNKKPEHYIPTSDIQSINSVWMDISSNGNSEIKKLFTEKAFAHPKPEGLLQRILEIATKPGDIVLDYHLGSATTCAVAHKMNRQYIGIEQMDYIQTVSVARLRKVIAGEQGGISKSVQWKGGGSFVYCELKKHNQDFIDRIEEAPDTEAILNIWEQMKQKSFLSYKVDIQKQDDHIEEFKQLTLPQQKEHLVALLDKNQLYVNLSSTDDEDFGINKQEKAISNDFYKGGTA